MSSDVRAEIQRLVDTFVSDLETLVRRAALETVAEALGGRAPGPRAQAPGRSQPVSRTGGDLPRWRARKAAAKPQGPAARGDRVRRSADQIEATGERIVRHVEENPGARSEDIRAALGLPKNEWQLTAKRLVDAGRLATKGEKRATAYFAKGAAKLGIVRRPGRGAPATPVDVAPEPPADEG